MTYEGKLYGKNKKGYFWLMLSTQDIDEMQKRLDEAEQRECKFAEWIGTKGYINRESNPNQWIQQMDTLAEEQFTTEQLYLKWMEEQSK